MSISKTGEKKSPSQHSHVESFCRSGILSLKFGERSRQRSQRGSPQHTVWAEELVKGGVLAEERTEGCALGDGQELAEESEKE